MFLENIATWSKSPVEHESGKTRENSSSMEHSDLDEHMLAENNARLPGPLAGGSQTARRDRISVERGVCPDLITLPDSDEDPIVVRLRHLNEAEAKPAQFCPHAPDGLFRSNMFEDDALDAGPLGLPKAEWLEDVHCRFVIGADGARSWTRAALGFKLEGESSEFFWGVLDGVPLTDFPDTRRLCCIHSATNGSILMVPREKNMVRIYIQISHGGELPNRSDITPDKLLNSANAILAPYTIQMPKVEWFTCYQIGQRLVDHWSWKNRAFLTGDACHTHSPKLGQGMNTSICDAFNLSWKLAHVLQGKAHPKILETYESERAPLAAQLIDIDKKVARLFSGTPAKDALDESGISLGEFRQAMNRGFEFASGTTVEYESSLLVVKPSGPHHSTEAALALAQKTPVGRRLQSHQVVGFADAKPCQTADLVPVDGKWRLMIFGGDIANSSDCLARFEQLLKHLRANEMTNGQGSVDYVAILASDRETLELARFDDLLRPVSTEHGFRYHDRIYTDEETYHDGHGHAYAGYGIDPQVGCIVVIRPDQHVALITKISDYDGIVKFFDEFKPSKNTPEI